MVLTHGLTRFSGDHSSSTIFDAEKCFKVTLSLAALIRPYTLSLPMLLCYKRKAVKAIWKQEASRAESQGIARVESATAVPAVGGTSASVEHACSYCPVCSQRLESRRCKLVCSVCGYYMSCADYY